MKKHGWLKEQIEKARRNYEQWPEWKKKAAEYDAKKRKERQR